MVNTMSYDAANLQGLAVGRSLIVAGVLSLLSNEVGVKAWFCILLGFESALGYCTIATTARAFEMKKKEAYALVSAALDPEMWTDSVGTGLLLLTHYVYIPLVYMLTISALSCTSTQYPHFTWRPLPTDCIKLTTVQCWVCAGCGFILLMLFIFYTIAYVSAVRVKDRRAFSARALSFAVATQAAHAAVWLWSYSKDTENIGIGAWRARLGLVAVGLSDLVMVALFIFWLGFVTESNRFDYETMAIIATTVQLFMTAFLTWNGVTMMIYHVSYESAYITLSICVTLIEAILAFFFQIASKAVNNDM